MFIWERKRSFGPSEKGFSFIEVMVALAILAVALVAIITAQSQSMVLVEKSRDISFHTEVLRLKMVELELEFRGKGFGEIEEEDSGEFESESLNGYHWYYKLKKIEVPKAAMRLGESTKEGAVGMGVIKDFFEKSIRQLVVRIIWGDEAKGDYLQATTFLTDPRALPFIPSSKGTPKKEEKTGGATDEKEGGGT